jgi:hypothetical protein
MPGDVWHIVDTALSQVLSVKESLKIKEKTEEPKSSPTTTPTDVYREVISVQRLFNNLL